MTVREDTQADPATRLWICEMREMVYDPMEGDPEGGVPPGMPFEDIPEEWLCPVCGARKKEVPADAAGRSDALRP